MGVCHGTTLAYIIHGIRTVSYKTISLNTMSKTAKIAYAQLTQSILLHRPTEKLSLRKHDFKTLLNRQTH